MKFSDIFGHDNTKQRLRQMVDQNRLPHALLIEGPEGSAKFALARALVQYIHCFNRTDGDSCGRCPACMQLQTHNHLDTTFVFPVVKKGGATVSDDWLPEFRMFMDSNPYMDFEQWLQAMDNINSQPQIFVDEAAVLIHRMGLMARNSRYKTLLLWLPERLKEEAANKLLKLVEEPADDTRIIMVSNNSQKILATIYSRMQRVVVKRYTDEEVADIIAAHASMDMADARQIARLASGNVNTALRLVSVSKERRRFLDMFMELMRKAYMRKIVDLRAWSNDLAALGREPQMQFYDYCSRLLRENFIYNLNVEQLNYLNKEELDFSKNFARFITNLNVFQLLEAFGDARADIGANGNAKIINFDVAIRVILLLKRDK